MTTFAELIRVGALEIGDGYRAKNAELGGDGPIFLRAALVGDGEITFRPAERFHETRLDRFAGKIGQPGDTVITTKGNSTGRVAFVHNGCPTFVYSPHLSYWRSTDPNVLAPGFLRAWSRGPEFRRQLAAMAGSTDMAPYLSLADQRRLAITLPPIDDQRTVGALLGGIDDKIELNRRVCRTLERLAEAVFRARFVDFEDVDELVESEIGWIPRGWRCSTLGAMASRATGSLQPSATPNELFELFSIPAFDAGAGPERVTGDAILSGKTPLAGPAILVSKLNPERKRVWWARPSGKGLPVCSGEFVQLVPREVPLEYLYAVVRHDPGLWDHLLANVSGTTGSRQRVSPGDVLAAPVVLPSSAAIESFASFARPLYQTCHLLAAESRTLAALRDALLPKLVSGEVRVRADDDLPEAVAP